MTDPTPPLTTNELAEQIARRSHVIYEQAAVAAGWATQESTQVGFDDLPESNRRTMITTFKGLLRDGVIEPGPAILDRFRGGPDAD